MAQKLTEPTSNVYAWQRVDRIPSDKQRRVLEIGFALGLPISPELVIFPSGHVPETIAHAICGQHRACSARRSPANPPADFHGVDRAPGQKYGNRSEVLATTAQMVPA